MTPAEKKEWAARRKDYLVGGPCAVCGSPAHDVHEIIAGANRPAAWKEPACWLRVCRSCHVQLQGMSAEYQLSFKLLSDPEYFDLKAFCKAWRRSDTAVDLKRLLEFVRLELCDANKQ